jgi:hypothetical protein
MFTIMLYETRVVNSYTLTGFLPTFQIVGAGLVHGSDEGRADLYSFPSCPGGLSRAPPQVARTALAAQQGLHKQAGPRGGLRDGRVQDLTSCHRAGQRLALSHSTLSISRVSPLSVHAYGRLQIQTLRSRARSRKHTLLALANTHFP